MKRILVIILIAMFGFVSIGNAEESKQKPSPEEVQKQMETTFSMMIPMMGKMMEAMIEAQLTVLAKPESAQKVAIYIKNLKEALIKQGFTKEEAIKIATSLPLPSAAMSSK